MRYRSIFEEREKSKRVSRILTVSSVVRALEARTLISCIFLPLCGHNSHKSFPEFQAKE